MESKINELLEKITLINKGELLEETCAIIQIEDINDIMLFSVGEINTNILTINFNNWIVFNDNELDEDYITQFPQAIIKYIEPAIYEISFECYGYDDILSKVTYKLCTTSVKLILNNLLNNQIKILFEVNNSHID